VGQVVLSDPFPRRDGALHCGPFRLDALAEQFGTPLYVYDLDEVERAYRRLSAAFEGVPLDIAYSVKANGSLAVLHRLAALGAGADIVSEGELVRCLRAGIRADRIVFAGVAKSVAELEAGLRAGIRAFNVESAGELRRLDEVAEREGRVAPFAIRVNPDVDSPTPHEYTRTVHAETKFGVPADEALELYRWARSRRHLRAVGVDAHIGSQIQEVAPFVKALRALESVVVELRAQGESLDFLDLGGGFGVAYDPEGTSGPGGMLDLPTLAAEVAPRVVALGLRLILEPGRSIIGAAGVLLTRVEVVKRSGTKTFVVVDGGMTELIRPSHYGGYHHIEAVVEGESDAPSLAARQRVDVVGPICESGDFLARDRSMVLPRPGDLLAVKTAGAYGFVMASNYNARRRPAEAAVSGGRVALVRSRETLADLTRGESMPWAHDTSAC
jgi:diaminopimelate decarboxylase